MNALAALPREVRGQTNGQEMTGGACSKMDAPRNGAATQIGFSAGSFENWTAGCAAETSAGASLCWYLPEAINVTAHSCWLAAASL